MNNNNHNSNEETKKTSHIEKKPIDIIDEGETIVREIVKVGYFSNWGINNTILMVLKETGNIKNNIAIKDIGSVLQPSMVEFAKRQYNLLMKIDKTLLNAMPKIEFNALEDFDNVKQKFYRTRQQGIPKGVGEGYIKQVRSIMNKYAQAQPIDPNDTKMKNTLRNRVELEVRYAGHNQNIEELKKAGVKLVISSVHQDCSDRCANFQGKVYSLDGTSGVTADGKAYEPLEKATNIYYTTKSGKTYKNGLLGFNCRHYLMEYVVGMKVPYITKKERKKEYALNDTQRHMEREIRAKRDEMQATRGIDIESFRKAHKEAISMNKQLKSWCLKNNRVYQEYRL